MSAVLIYMSIAVLLNAEFARRIKDGNAELDKGHICRSGIDFAAALCVVGLQICLVVQAAKEIWP